MEQHDFDPGSKEDLCRYRIETAKKDIISAKTLYEIEDYRGANNRAYYAIYHAISAVHALDGKAYKKHKDAIANFNFSYVKTQIFDPSLGKRINEAEKIRHASDYDDFYVVSISETQDQIQTAIDFVEAVEKYCENRINN